jgi:hypothetical protein
MGVVLFDALSLWDISAVKSTCVHVASQKRNKYMYI